MIPGFTFDHSASTPGCSAGVQPGAKGNSAMTMKTTGSNEDGQRKKRYETPRLETYGDIRVVTEAVAHNSNNADGGAKALKTA